ncbi:winged helix-turn-helix transcriptional regulator [Natronosporangium hydrolyticum]|uniref:Winged helix-turn-helix transcriptional regulator n=1 Tax=Natronosporangium hydrolyticum TaxID=2811111 RepID=A0A895YHM4_9ACTN|nr:winged helix-turn-helix domain-containing protein [Natronosporangium hydrolyticum]QSB14036.1 winged helix-turn-helix transcriptional regulator [Natronosporangium hydrolyticum]
MSPRSTAWGAYREIATALRERIAGGEFAPGAALPSEADLCEQYAVARNTLRRALDQLAADGLIVTHPGRGRVVADAQGGAGGSVPQYRAVAAQLRALIDSGDLAPGDPLPSESALAQSHGVSRGTARHALAELEGAGLVEAVHGRGRFVRQRQ